jgi:hypothetical protein
MQSQIDFSNNKKFIAASGAFIAIRCSQMGGSSQMMLTH